MSAGFNDLATTHPELTTEWHPVKNGELTPQMVIAGSGKKVWWLGPCGHEWEAAINNRANGAQCPYCTGRMVLLGFNDLSTTNPELVDEWHPTKNGSLMPQQVTAGSNRRVWWKCEVGHEWITMVADRSRGSACPTCAREKRKGRRRVIDPDTKKITYIPSTDS